MSGILDHLSRTMTFMRAENVNDVVAIALARRLEDVASLHRYQRYTRRLPVALVLDGYAKASGLATRQARAERVKAECEARLRGEEAHA